MSEPPHSGVACVVFSKDRPLQLDALLRSLENNCEDSGEIRVTTLYVASVAYYAGLYRQVMLDHPSVEFRRETDFRSDVVDSIGQGPYVLFLVDDSLFVSSFHLRDALNLLERDPGCLGFSLRLGRNTTYCYAQDKPQHVPSFDDTAAPLLVYSWPGTDCDFEYPLELSSSIYRSSDLLPLLKSLDYRNPNTLEAALADRARDLAARLPRLACYERSVALSIPANLVQTAWPNRVSALPELDAMSLARRYERGWRVDVHRYQGFLPNSCHQELDFFFTRDHAIPTVSVIIPCYMQAEFLAEAMASLLQQTFADWEALIVDDGSPDDTTEVAQTIALANPSRRISILATRNGGVARARNRAVAAARGRFILPLDADDQIAPTMLERCVDTLELHPEVAIVYTDLQRFGAADELIRTADFDPEVIPFANQLNYCALYRREVWEAVQGYNPNMARGYEDWDFWVGAVERGYRAMRIPEPLFRYRIRDGSRDVSARLHDRELRMQIQRNHPSLYTPMQRMRRFGRIRIRGWWARFQRSLGWRDSRSSSDPRVGS